jgi:inorganic pyrophosphatase
MELSMETNIDNKSINQKDIDNFVNVYIEIKQYSIIKYEYNKQTNQLEIDRILNNKFPYPYAYGFIPNTLADDGDELDILIITNKHIDNNAYYNVFIIGALEMQDEKGNDEKLLCVLEEDYDKFNQLEHLSDDTLDTIMNFFSNYKNNEPNKWSKVGCFMNKTDAVKLYKKSLLQMTL